MMANENEVHEDGEVRVEQGARRAGQDGQSRCHRDFGSSYDVTLKTTKMRKLDTPTMSEKLLRYGRRD